MSEDVGNARGTYAYFSKPQQNCGWVFVAFSSPLSTLVFARLVPTYP